MGNLLSLVTLTHFRMAGYRPIVLLGGATGLIGDPSGRSTERNLLDESTVESNILSFQKQFSRLDGSLLENAIKNNLEQGDTIQDVKYVNNLDFYNGLNTV